MQHATFAAFRCGEINVRGGSREHARARVAARATRRLTGSQARENTERERARIGSGSLGVALLRFQTFATVTSPAFGRTPRVRCIIRSYFEATLWMSRMLHTAALPWVYRRGEDISVDVTHVAATDNGRPKERKNRARARRRTAAARLRAAAE